jgi:hypothetical protein
MSHVAGGEAGWMEALTIFDPCSSLAALIIKELLSLVLPLSIFRLTETVRLTAPEVPVYGRRVSRAPIQLTKARYRESTR